MKNNNEQKSNFVHRLINTTLKLKKELIDNQSNASVYKFKYELPESFLKAVDNARITAGYDALPRHRQRTASSTAIHQETSPLRDRSDNNKDQMKSNMNHSFSTNDLNQISTITARKVPFRRKPRHPKTPQVFVPPRPAFRMMMNPNLMWMNRPLRPATISPMPRPQRPAMFRLRFR